MPVNITVLSTQECRSLFTSINTDAELDDNKVGSTGSRYSSNYFRGGKGKSSYYSIPHNRTYTYKSSIFCGFVASPPLVRNTILYFLFLYFLSPSVSTVLTLPQFWAVTCPHLSDGLGLDVCGLPPTSVTPCYT